MDASLIERAGDCFERVRAIAPDRLDNGHQSNDELIRSGNLDGPPQRAGTGYIGRITQSRPTHALGCECSARSLRYQPPFLLGPEKPGDAAS